MTGSTTCNVLGLDPSTVATGWALLAVEGRDEGVVASGVYHPPKGSLDERLAAAYHWLNGIDVTHDPHVLAIETPFFKLNARTLAVLAGLGAAFRLAATLAGMRVVEITPAGRCTGIGLAGNASKSQVLYTVNAIYGLNLTDHNEADAVAIAAAAAVKLREARLEDGHRESL